MNRYSEDRGGRVDVDALAERYDSIDERQRRIAQSGKADRRMAGANRKYKRGQSRRTVKITD